jgi:hypothetical protein
MGLFTPSDKVIMRMMVGRRDLELNIGSEQYGGLIFFMFTKSYLS